MGNLLPVNEWVDVPYFETNAVLTGGPDCPDNIPIQALLNRTEWLKNQVDKTMPSLRVNDALPVLDIGVIWHDSYGLMAWSAAAAMYKQVRTATAGGTANAIIADFYPQPPTLDALHGIVIHVRAAAANTGAATLKIGALSAVSIVKGANAELVPGDIAGAGHWLALQYDKTLSKFVLLNPARGVNIEQIDVASLPMIGNSQSWVDVTGSRSCGVTYTNTSGKPIMVFVHIEGGTILVVPYVGGVKLGESKSTYNSGSPDVFVTFIVPGGATYLVTRSDSGNTATTWTELR